MDTTATVILSALGLLALLFYTPIWVPLFTASLAVVIAAYAPGSAQGAAAATAPRGAITRGVPAAEGQAAPAPSSEEAAPLAAPAGDGAVSGEAALAAVAGAGAGAGVGALTAAGLSSSKGVESGVAGGVEGVAAPLEGAAPGASLGEGVAAPLEGAAPGASLGEGVAAPLEGAAPGASLGEGVVAPVEETAPGASLGEGVVTPVEGAAPGASLGEGVVAPVEGGAAPADKGTASSSLAVAAPFAAAGALGGAALGTGVTLAATSGSAGAGAASDVATKAATGLNGASVSTPATVDAASLAGETPVEATSLAGAAQAEAAGIAGEAPVESAALSGEAPVDAAALSGEAPVEAAALSGEAPVEAAALSGEAPVDAAALSGEAPVEAAALSGEAPVEAAALSGEAPVDAAALSGEAPVEAAALSGEAPVEAAALSGEAPVDAAALSGEAPVDAASVAVPAAAGAATAAGVTAALAAGSPASDAAASAGASSSGGAAILAKLRAKRDAPAAAPAVEIPVMYGSQTGTAEELARTLALRLTASGVPARSIALDNYGFSRLMQQKPARFLVIVSSTGDGDPPDNAARFFAAARRRPEISASLEGSRFSLLGLGDSNYTRFARAPRALRSRIVELGATELFPGVDADEVDGIEHAAEPWMDGVAAVLEAEAKEDAAAAAAGSAAGSTPTAGVVGEPLQRSSLSSSVPASPLSAPASTPRAEGSDGGYAATGTLPPVPAPRLTVSWLPVGSPEAAAVIAQEAKLEAATAEVGADGTVSAPQGSGLSADSPVYLPISDARWMTNIQTTDKHVLRLELADPTGLLTSEPGDAVGVLAPNPPDVVDALLSRLALAPDAVFDTAPAPGAVVVRSHLAGTHSARNVFTHRVDVLSPPRKLALRTLAPHAADPAERAELVRLSSPQGREDYEATVRGQGATLLDVLRRFPSLAPPFDVLLDALPPLRPRFYSVTTSREVHPRAFAFCLSMAVAPTPSGAQRIGLASGYLRSQAEAFVASARLVPGARTASYAAGIGKPVEPARLDGAVVAGAPLLPVFLRPGGNFRPPADPRTPIVMVAPGTGVAPFLGFLEDRRSRMEQLGGGLRPGPAWLFFGCRRDEEDFIYKRELLSFVQDHTLGHLVVAFSRAIPGQKVYVQDNLRARADAVYSTIVEDGGSLYICGDGSNMAKGVHQALTDIWAEKNGGKDDPDARKKAEDQLEELVRERRYLADIWSAVAR